MMRDGAALWHTTWQLAGMCSLLCLREFRPKRCRPLGTVNRGWGKRTGVHRADLLQNAVMWCNVMTVIRAVCYRMCRWHTNTHKSAQTRPNDRDINTHAIPVWNFNDIRYYLSSNWLDWILCFLRKMFAQNLRMCLRRKEINTPKTYAGK